ncbi:MAG: hypothetical protein K2M94_07505 [Paramuribaculum sp.]|nr:hypothetical protein [Paramuribaculum sp.]
MKTKIYYLLTLLALFTCSAGFLSSCSDDEESPSGDALIEKLQGNWIFEKMKMNVLGQTIEMTADDLRNSPGVGSNVDFYDESLSFNGTKVNGKSYKVDGNRVMLPWYEDVDWWAKVSFSDSQMIMEYDVTSEGINIKMWAYYNRTGRAASAVLPSESDPTLLPAILKIDFLSAE